MNRALCKGLVAAIGMLGACNASHSDGPPSPTTAPVAAPAPRASTVTPWTNARTATGSTLLELPARVVASPQAAGAIAPPYPARVMKILSRPGERVVRGAPIFEVIMPQVCSAAGAYVAAEMRAGAYGKRKAALESLRSEGLVRASEIIEIDTRLAEARADQQAALSTLLAAGLGASDASRILQNGGTVALRSPVAGIVTELNVAIGETRDGTSAPMARIQGDGTARIEARVAPRLPEPARFELEEPTGARTPLRLIATSPSIDPQDGTRLAWFEPTTTTTTSNALGPGTAGRLIVVLPESSAAVLVPATAIDGGHVIVEAAPTERRIPVRVLALSGADALVEAIAPARLSVGDRIATDATALRLAQQLAPGTTP